MSKLNCAYTFIIQAVLTKNSDDGILTKDIPTFYIEAIDNKEARQKVISMFSNTGCQAHGSIMRVEPYCDQYIDI